MAGLDANAGPTAATAPDLPRRLRSGTALLRVLAALAAAPAFVALAPAPAWADGGAGAGPGSAGGEDSVLGTGGQGVAGGGGGAGVIGGDGSGGAEGGRRDGGGSSSGGETSPNGANGGAEPFGGPGTGGGGGAHGAVADDFSGQSFTGGNGGNGGGPTSNGQPGGGGGAGGYGLVVTGAGALGPADGAYVGGSGGRGGFGASAGSPISSDGGNGGSGGIGLYFTNDESKSLTIGGQVRGGAGGLAGLGYDGTIFGGGEDGAAGHGGTGIYGSNLDIALTDDASVMGGLGAAGPGRSFHFAGGNNTLRIAQDATILGGIHIQSGTLTFDQGAHYALSQTISGAGNVVKSGIFSLALSGENTYSGSTTISGGTLALTEGASLASTNLSVGMDGILRAAAATLDAETAIELAGAMYVGTNAIGSLRGSGTLRMDDDTTLTVGAGDQDSNFEGYLLSVGNVTIDKIGAGTFIYDVQITNADLDITVSAGTMIVNNLNPASMGVLVRDGGTLGGTGSVGSTIIESGGTLAPGNSIGTFAVENGLTFEEGSFLEVDISPDRAALTSVAGTGSADLSGATVLALYEPGDYVSKRYLILRSEDGLGGTEFAGVEGIAPAGFVHSLGYDEDNAWLDLELALASYTGLSFNRQQVADALLTYFDTEGGLPPDFALLSPEGLGLASAETGAGAAASARHAAGLFLDTFARPWLGGPAVPPAPLGYAGATDTVSDRFETGFANLAPPTDAGGRQAWGAMTGGGLWLPGDAAAGSSQLSSRAYGVASGVDWISGGTRLGAGLGGSWSDFDVEGHGSGRVGTFSAGLRGSHDFGGGYVSAAGAYGYHDASTRRELSGETYTAGFGAHSLSGRIEAGTRMEGGLMPYAAAQAVALATPAYAEAGSGAGTFALAHDADETLEGRLELGARLARTLVDEAGLTVFSGRLAYAHALDPENAATAGFVALPGTGFVSRGAKRDRHTALVSASVERRWDSGLSGALTFDGEFGEDTVVVQAGGSLSLRW